MDFLKYLNGKEYKFGMASIKIADKDNFEKLQLGFRSNGKEVDNLVSNEPNNWKPSWYVIGKDTMLGDPFFIDTNDNCVYHVGHDCDYDNDTTKLASNINVFISMLEIVDKNLNGIDGLDVNKKIELVQQTISEMKNLDPGIDMDYFKNSFNIFLNIEK